MFSEKQNKTKKTNKNLRMPSAGVVGALRANNLHQRSSVEVLISFSIENCTRDHRYHYK